MGVVSTSSMPKGANEEEDGPLLEQGPDDQQCCDCCCTCCKSACCGPRTAEKTESEKKEMRKRFDEAHPEKGWALFSYEDMPTWLRDNEFILGGYRRPYSTWGECLKSLFKLHNESVNVWSHLFPMIVLAIVSPFVFSAFQASSELGGASPDEAEALLDKLELDTSAEGTRRFEQALFEYEDAGEAYILPFLFGAMACLSLSGSYHLFKCNGRHTHAWLHKLDYVGITLLIVGSFYPFIYYAFYCRPSEQIAYLSAISGMGLIVSIFVLWPRFGTPEYRKFRAGLFSLLGLAGVVPAVHFFILECADAECKQRNIGITFLLSMAASYLIGAVFYAKRFPEKQWPGKFDVLFSSHQIFHVLVVFGVAIHFAGAIWMRSNRLYELGPCPAS